MSKRSMNKISDSGKKSKNIKPTNGKGNKESILKNFQGFDKKQLIDILKMMLRARTIDSKAMRLLKQGKTFFHISADGHEAVQAAIGLQLDPKKDWLFPYYRDLGTALMAGVTPEEVFLGTFAKATDPASGGRQLPVHWGMINAQLPSQSSPTGTQFLQAVGTALASKRRGIKNVSYVSSGEGTTSQGEFHEAVNWASREKLPVLFVIENNKYAIKNIIYPIINKLIASPSEYSDFLFPCAYTPNLLLFFLSEFFLKILSASNMVRKHHRLCQYLH